MRGPLALLQFDDLAVAGNGLPELTETPAELVLEEDELLELVCAIAAEAPSMNTANEIQERSIRTSRKEQEGGAEGTAPPAVLLVFGDVRRARSGAAGADRGTGAGRAGARAAEAQCRGRA